VSGREGKMERRERGKGLRRGWEGGGEVGDDLEGCGSECRIRWCLTPIPRRRSLAGGQ
jgi:hypothetical protein